MLGHVSKWLLSPSFQKHIYFSRIFTCMYFFLAYLLCEPGWAHRVNLIKLWGPSHGWVPLQSVTLSCPPWASSKFINDSAGFPPGHWFPWDSVLISQYSSISPILGTVVCHVCSPVLQIQEEFFFFFQSVQLFTRC